MSYIKFTSRRIDPYIKAVAVIQVTRGRGIGECLRFLEKVKNGFLN
ncbi:MAG: hypothetical protein ACP5KW_07900 [Thermoproteota archaeon]